MNTIKATSQIENFVEIWNEAKANQRGWEEVRKQAEADLTHALQGEIAERMENLKGSTSLTTGVSILGRDGRPIIKMTVGEDLRLDQVGAVQFLTRYPDLTGVVFKTEQKPIVAAILNKLLLEDQLAEDLSEVCIFKDKTPAFSAV